MPKKDLGSVGSPETQFFVGLFGYFSFSKCSEIKKIYGRGQIIGAVANIVFAFWKKGVYYKLC